jgi:hypothetical protein
MGKQLVKIHANLSPIPRGFAPGFVDYKKGALDSQPQVITFTSCLPMVGGSLRVLRLIPPLKLVLYIVLSLDRHFNKNVIWVQEEFEDVKRLIRNRKSEKDRQHNGQKKKDKRTNNDLLKD